MAIFVLVVDTSLMNASIAAVVHDLDTTVSGVQSAIALEALVSAVFILIGGKVGDLIGRKRAYVLGLVGYAIGAAAMTVARGPGAIVVFWAVIGGVGASLLPPSMQSLIHGNFEGGARTRVSALVGAAAAIAAVGRDFTSAAESSTVLAPADQQVAQALEQDAQVMSNTQLTGLLADEPPAVQEEIVRINTVARPPALQVALVVPLLAGLLGLFNSFRMMRLKDPEPSGATEVALGG